MDKKTLANLPKDELIQMILDQSDELRQLDRDLESEVEENRFFKSLGYVEGYTDYRSYFIDFFEDESEGTAKKGSIFLGIFEDFVKDYGSGPVLDMLDQFMDDHV